VACCGNLSENWKRNTILLPARNEDRLALFDLATDPGEQQDLYRQHPSRADALRTELRAWQQEIGARFPTPNPNYDPARPSGRDAARQPGPARP
jgi:hypothetical protein